MKTFFSCVSAGLFLISQSYAGTMGEVHVDPYGLYVGINGGANFNSQNIKGNFSMAGIDSTTITVNSYLNNNGYYPYSFIGFQGGYRLPVRSMYSIALEGFGQYNSGKSKIFTNGQNASVDDGLVVGTLNLSSSYRSELNSIYGVRVLPGFEPTNNVLVYGIFGVGFANFKNKVEGTLHLSSLEQDTLIVFNTHKNSNKTAAQLGAGMEFFVLNHIGIGANYIYSDYGTIKLNRSDVQTIEDVDTFAQNIVSRQKTTNHEVSLHVNYYFNV